MLPIAGANALNQSTASGYASTANASPEIGPISSGVPGKCIDDTGNGSANGTSVQLWDCNGGASQSWTLMPDGTVRINGKCIVIHGAATANGTALVLWDCNGGWNEVWQASGGQLVNPVSGRCAADPGGSQTNGTQLVIWDCVPGAYHMRWAPAGGLVADSSGHGSQASWSGSVGFGAPGLAGDRDTAMSLDGAGAFVQLPSSIFGSYPTSGSTNAYTLSFEAWFQTTTAGGGVILGQNGGSGGGSVPAIYVDSSGKVRESLFSHGGTQNLAAGPYNDGKPHQVVATYANGTDSLYVDGQLKQSQQLSESGYSGSYDYQLGTGYAWSAPGVPSGVTWYSFKGTIDEASVYGTALPASRVQAHFNAGAGYKAAVLADAPAAYYRLDDQSGGGNPFNGYGLWPVRRTDANGQTTTTGYDPLGRQTSVAQPGEPGGGAPGLVADVSGHGLQAAWGGGVGFGAPGLVSGAGDTAASLDGSTGSVSTPLVSQGMATVEAWFQLSSLPSGPPAGGGQLPHGRRPPGLPDGHQLGWDRRLRGRGHGERARGRELDAAAVGGDALPLRDDVRRRHREGVPERSPGGEQSGHGSDGALAASGDVGAGPGVQLHRLVRGDAGRGCGLRHGAGAGYRAALLADAPIAYYSLGDSGPSQSTQTTTYTVWCQGTSAQTPCVEVDRSDPFYSWDQQTQENLGKVWRQLEAFNEKQDELLRDSQGLYRGNPQYYNEHINAIRAIQSRIQQNFGYIRNPDAAAQLRPYVDEATGFDPVSVRGWAQLPPGMTKAVTEEGEPIPYSASFVRMWSRLLRSGGEGGL